MGSIVQSRFSQIDDSCSRIKAYRILSHIGPSMISIGTRQDQDTQAAKKNPNHFSSSHLPASIPIHNPKAWERRLTLTRSPPP